MAVLDMITKYCKKYILNIESIILFLFLFVIYNYLFNSENVWELIDKIKVKIELKVNGRFDQIPNANDDEIFSQKDKAFWDLAKGDACVYAIQGRRPHMEDRFNVVSDLEDTDTSIYGIFDGHGGDFASDFTEKTLFKSIMVQLLQSQINGKTNLNISAVLTDEILKVDEQLLKIAQETSELSGTTALVATVRGNTLTVANVGDSRGVLCDKDGNTIPLSFDHKPQQLRERQRIKRAGGFISFNGVWRVAGVLATSRALGDFPLKEKNLVIANPDILTFNLDEIQPLFMVLATDGLWDTFSNTEAVDFIKTRLHEPHFGAKSLVLQSYYRGSMDNITVMVVKFLNGKIAQVKSAS